MMIVYKNFSLVGRSLRSRVAAAPFDFVSECWYVYHVRVSRFEVYSQRVVFVRLVGSPADVFACRLALCQFLNIKF